MDHTAPARRAVTATLCGHCAAPVADQGHLCHGCTRRLRGVLDDVPSLLGQLRITRARQTSMPASTITAEGCTHAGDCGCGVTLPWDDHASHVARGLRDAVTTWCRHLADDTGQHPRRGDILTAWLIGHLDDIRRQPWAPAMLTDLTRRRGEAYRAIDTPEDRLYAGPCGGTVHLGDGITVQCERRIWARPEETAVRCRACGTTHVVADRQAYMLAAAADLLMPGPQVCSVLTTILRVRVSPSTLRSWVGRGRLVKRGRRGGSDLYRFGDALDLWRAGDRGEIPA